MKHFNFILMRACTLLFLLLLILKPAKTDTSPLELMQDPAAPIIFIYDASGSMWGKMEGSTKVEIARKVLSNTVDQLAADQRIGFVAYGHRQKGDCEDVEYLVAPSNTSKEQIKEQIKGIMPLGKTPLAYSALQVIEKLKGTQEKATIILITDGIESCGGNLCEVIQQAREAGVDFRMHIVGFGLSGENLDPLKCAAQAGNGKYYDAADADELTAALEEVTQQTVDQPDFNLAVYSTKNGEAIDSWVKAYEAGTKKEAGGVRTYQDTGFIALTPGSYDLVVQALENSDVPAQTITGIEVQEEGMTFQTISFDAGKIMVRSLMNGEGWDATVGIVLTEDGKPAAGGRTYGRDKFYDVAPGTYSIKLTGLKIRGLETVKIIEGVKVQARDTTLVEHNFKTGTARIGALGKSGLMDATIKIVEKSSQQAVGGGRTYTADSSNPKEFLLNPGEYTVTLVSVREFKGEKRSFEMTIKQGETFEKMIQY